MGWNHQLVWGDDLIQMDWNHQLGLFCLNIFFLFSPLFGEDDLIWLYNIFQVGWNHQLGFVWKGFIDLGGQMEETCSDTET